MTDTATATAVEACPECPRTFASSAGLSIHLVRSHGIESSSLAAVRRRAAPDRQPEELPPGKSFVADWRDDAACIGQPPEMFFPEVMELDGGAGRRRPDVVDAERPALALCATCTVRAACLEWALDHEQFGVWGGTTAMQRARLRRRSGEHGQNGVDPVAARAAHLLRRGWTEDEIAVELGLPSIDAVRRLTVRESA